MPPILKKALTQWANLVKTSKFQIYISRSFDPYLNLSIEHFLLQQSPSNSVVLFLYTNTPCVVIGRNQNPWLEAKLDLLKRGGGDDINGAPPDKEIPLIRRRSGGGTVFHDPGNINYSVICPPGLFTRNKHAEMVTSAIRKFNDRARVNDRHDIVLDQGSLLPEADRPPSEDMRRSKYTSSDQPLKVSGSAYKMVRSRTLHHGTCLLRSPNLSRISRILSSPARGFLKVKGIESVRSPVGNIFDRSESGMANIIVTVQRAIINSFLDMYNIRAMDFSRRMPELAMALVESTIQSKEDCSAGTISEDAISHPDISTGLIELKSQSWLFEQTPQFTLLSHPEPAEDTQGRPKAVSLPSYFPSQARVHLHCRHGRITESKISLTAYEGPPQLHQNNSSISNNLHKADAFSSQINDALKDKLLHELDDFSSLLSPHPISPPTGGDANHGANQVWEEATGVMRWLNEVFGKGVTS